MSKKYKKALVVGGAGFIGSHVVDALIKQRVRVYVIDDLSSGKSANLNPNAKFYKMSITSPNFSKLVQRLKPDVIFHFAAQIDVRKSVADPLYDARINIMGSLNLITAANSAGVKKIIFASSGGCMYPDRLKPPYKETIQPEPISPYGIAKRAIELYLDFANLEYGIQTVALRFANVYGPRQNAGGEAGVIAIFSEKMLSGKQPVIFGNGKQTRDYVYVGDVVRACLAAMNRNVSGRFNIGTGRQTDLIAIFKKLKKITGSNAVQKHQPAKPGEVMRSALHYGLAEKKLGWKPKVKFDDGLKMTVEWFRKKIN
ncbi:MAG: NAD-dependent epimerase/dehydratase family protein [Candidatus Uhrbacteria bacterium]|nr:NAD-dependent epimerase/dehydratase family protein [Patescibacteria group bacterium]MBU1906526.1 NAD-dependent epimerase/dehydratase family protein [Patescibacteria group bacterium]